jgi:hypothetical protein
MIIKANLNNVNKAYLSFSLFPHLRVLQGFISSIHFVNTTSNTNLSNKRSDTNLTVTVVVRKYSYEGAVIK